MNKLTANEKMTTALAALAIGLSLFSLWQVNFQFRAQDESDLLANCSFGSQSEAFIIKEFGEVSTLKVKAKCLVQNNGRKAASIIKVRSIETYNGRPSGRRIVPIVLYDNDLVKPEQIPITVFPGESIEIDVWLKIYLDPLNKGEKYLDVFENCYLQAARLSTYQDYDNCLSKGDFFIANFLTIEPLPYADLGLLGSSFNGVGIQLFTNDNMATTYEVDVLRMSMFGLADKASKEFDDGRDRFSNKGLYLEKGFRENLAK